AVLSDAGEDSDDTYAGSAVAISGDGTTALLSDDHSPSGGGASVYHVSAEDAWTSTSTPTAILSDATSVLNDAFGFALALSGDGTVALVGGPLVGSRTGAVDVFHASAKDAW